MRIFLLIFALCLPLLAQGTFPQTVTLSGDATLGATQLNKIILCTGGSGGVTGTLPAASASTGKVYFMKKVDAGAGACTFARAGSDTIDGATSFAIAAQYGFAWITSDGTTWHIIDVNPTLHAARHATGAVDAVTLAESQVTNLTTDLGAKLPLAGGTMTGALSIGVYPITKTETAGSTGTTVGLLVSMDTAGQMVTTALSAVGALGIAMATQTSGNAFEMASRGIVTNGVADNSTTVGNLLGVGTTTAGRQKDLGQTASTGVCTTVQIIGRAKTAVSAAAALSLEFYGPGHYGSKLCAADLPNPGASTLGGVKSLTCTGTDKLSALGTDGVPVCSTDATGTASVLSAPHLQDEFLGGGSGSATIGETDWSFSGGTTASLQGEANHPGIIQRNTSTTVSTVASLYHAGTSSNSKFIPADTWDLTWIVRPSAVGATTPTVRIGLSGETGPSLTGAQPATGFYFEHLSTDTNWFLVLRVGSADKCVSNARVDSTVAFAGATWFRMRIRRFDASTIKFSINGAAEISCTDTAATATQRAWTVIVNNTASTAETLDHDLWTLDFAGLTR